MIYAVLNPIPWTLFLLGVILCVFSVKAFHRKYPQYPFGNEVDDEAVHHVADSISSLHAGIGHDTPAVEGLGR